ncbi:MAG TPA: adenylate/guanylate cyclase domain-containing protein [Solirubrobacterales bacterium]|nr:adenylate/guanylate cyclase domain-containing protein [Solirubrobacterales bacterium]
MATEAPETRYARSGEFSIAYQVVGEGDLDLVYMPGFASHLEVFWEQPAYSRFLHRLASFSRLVMIDRLGTGLSDRLPTDKTSTLEQRMDDIQAVMDAVGIERAALLGWSEGVMPCATFAATYPERATALVMYGGMPRILEADDYEWGVPEEMYDEWVDTVQDLWGHSGAPLRFWAPTVADDPEPQRWFQRFTRLAASPGAAAALFKSIKQTDIRDVLPTIQVPTLIIHRTEDALVQVEHSRYMAERIPGARLVEFPGEDHLWWFGDQDVIVDEVQEFLTGARSAPAPDRVLATVMFTDIVGSTDRAAELGDRRWRELLEGHEAVVRRELARHRGSEVKTTGDGFLATFDGPARAISCARAIADAVRPLGIEIRAGLHTGECEVMNGDVGGIAVHTGARVSAEAGPSEVLVSSTVKDLVAGSGIEFEDRGSRELKGVPGEWRLYAVAA